MTPNRSSILVRHLSEKMPVSSEVPTITWLFEKTLKTECLL